MLAARRARSLLFDWVFCGGQETLDSYWATGFADIPREHWECHFLQASEAGELRRGRLG